MKINKLSILFLLDKVKTNRQGKCPIKCRITYNGKRKPLSSGLFINPKNWYSTLQLAKPPNKENTFINNELSLIKNKINQAFLMLQIQETEFTVEDIYNQYKGKATKQNYQLGSYYLEHLEKYKKLIGIEIKEITWNKFYYIYNDVKDFIKWKYKQNDILLKNLDYSFIVEFEYYLKTEKLQKQVTINKVLQRLKKVVKTAVTNKLIESFPFTEHKPKKVTTNVVYLTVEELEKLEAHLFIQARLQLVKDLFVLCCYTGLAFNEMSKLEAKHIVDGFDGNKWIKMIRDKTNKEISIPLLPKALEMLTLLASTSEGKEKSLLLPSISNQKFNSYLKEIGEIVGIDKNLTHHIGRKTFATTVLLYNDVPMEIVSELLGHSKMSTTQEHYGKIIQKKVSEHINILGKKLDNK